MRFNPYSDEETCSKIVTRRGQELVCLRTKGHAGDCIPEANKAGEADGVRWCCRVMLEAEHEKWCPLEVRT